MSAIFTFILISHLLFRLQSLFKLSDPFEVLSSVCQQCCVLMSHFKWYHSYFNETVGRRRNKLENLKKLPTLIYRIDMALIDTWRNFKVNLMHLVIFLGRKFWDNHPTIDFLETLLFKWFESWSRKGIWGLTVETLEKSKSSSGICGNVTSYG